MQFVGVYLVWFHIEPWIFYWWFLNWGKYVEIFHIPQCDIYVSTTKFKLNAQSNCSDRSFTRCFLLHLIACGCGVTLLRQSDGASRSKIIKLSGTRGAKWSEGSGLTISAQSTYKVLHKPTSSLLSLCSDERLTRKFTSNPVFGS